MKKNMKCILRMLCALLALAMLGSAFVGCGKKETTTDPKPNTNGGNTKPGTTPPTTEPSTTPSTTEPAIDPSVDEDPEPITLNIGTYNIANGRQVNHNMMVLAADIVNNKLDVVGLQEVDMFCDRSKNMDTMKTLSELTQMPYYTFFKAINLSGNGPSGSGEYGVGVLSKYPIVETERIELYSTGETRVLGRTKIDVDGTKINFFTTHLEWSPDATRYKQLEQLDAIMAQHDNFVVVGDFNVHTLTEYRKLSYKGMVNTEEDPILTYSSTDGDWYLDNIIYSPEDWTFTNRKTHPNGHSDHFLLHATGTFMPKGRTTVKDSEGKELPTLSDGLKATAENIGKWANGTAGAYVEVDLGTESLVSAVKVINQKTCDSVYKWAVYGTEDATLPIDQWTKLCEKTNDDKATGAGYTAAVSEDNAKLPIRYIRVYATYHSGDENYQIAEVEIQSTVYVEEKYDLTSKGTIKNQDGKAQNSLKDGVTDKYIKVGEWAKDCYVEIDLGETVVLNSLLVYHPVGDGDRIYKWVVYASADNTLPIEKWTKIGEKNGDELADDKGHLVKVPKDLRDDEFRYVRVCAVSYNKDKNFHLTEVTVYGITTAYLKNPLKDATIKAGNGRNCDTLKDGSTSGYVDLGYWCDSDENEAAGIPVGTAGTCYIEIDMSKLYNLESLKVVNLVSPTRIYKWTAFITDDNTKPIEQWTEIGGKTNDNTSSADGYTVTLTDAQKNTPIRYIRIYGMYHSDNWGYHISEVMVSGTVA